MGPEALPYLSGQLTRKPGPLERFGNLTSDYVPARVRAFVRRFYYPRKQVMQKREVALALTAMGTNAQGAVGALGQMLHDPNVLLSSSASIALGEIGPASVPVLVQALNDPDYNVRSGACAALSRLGTNSAPAAPRLADIIQHETGPIVTTAAHTLSQIGAAVVPAVKPMITSTNSNVRRFATMALANADSEEGVDALVTLAQDPERLVRWSAVASLGQTGARTRSASDALFASLNDSDVNVRSTAAGILSHRLRSVREHMDAFITLLDDPSPQIRSSAAFALSLAGQHSSNAVPRLESLLTDTNHNVRESAAEALRSITNSLQLVRQHSP